MNYILGLDISTSVIGMAVMDLDKNLIHYRNLKMSSKDDLEVRCWQFKQDLLSIFEYDIEAVYVEQPAMMFGGGKTTAQTMSKLQRFNGMCCYAVYTQTFMVPHLVHANTARKKMNIKIPRNVKKKKTYIVEQVKNKYPSFNYELTRFGNPKPGTDDIADAIVIAHAGVCLYKEGLNAVGEDQISK
tara:strand:- start:74 stop:631 length:558 start_codon:yes stop_codon:yes gene_type:complete